MEKIEQTQYVTLYAILSCSYLLANFSIMVSNLILAFKESWPVYKKRVSTNEQPHKGDRRIVNISRREFVDISRKSVEILFEKDFEFNGKTMYFRGEDVSYNGRDLRLYNQAARDFEKHFTHCNVVIQEFDKSHWYAEYDFGIIKWYYKDLAWHIKVMDKHL